MPARWVRWPLLVISHSDSKGQCSQLHKKLVRRVSTVRRISMYGIRTADQHSAPCF